jgi:precorrin-6B methylase 2
LFNLEETDVIADVTGGTASISCAIASACTSFGIDMEYIEQDEKGNLIKLQLHKN